MAVDTFIPEVWAASLLTTLEKSLVFGGTGITNRDYEGDISQFGDTVHVNFLTDPTVATYTKNSTTISPQTLTTADEDLVIDQTPYFAFEVDDIDARQVRNGGDLMSKASQRAAFRLRDTADQFLATTIVAGAGEVFDPETITTVGDAFRFILRAMAELDRNDVPQDGRFLAVGPDFHAAILGDSRFIDASKYGSSTPIRAGEVGMVLGFTVYKSNNLPEGTYAGSVPAYSRYVVAGHPIATTFAQQINKVEAYRPESAFSDAVKGLHVYGAKVLRPEALVVQDTDVNLETITLA
jgi:N4-gp56 family major capsid protein